MNDENGPVDSSMPPPPPSATQPPPIMEPPPPMENVNNDKEDDTEEEKDDDETSPEMEEDTEDSEEEEEKSEEPLAIPEEFMFGVEKVKIDPKLLKFSKWTRRGRGGKRSKIFSLLRGRFVKAIFPRGGKKSKLAVGK